MHRQGWQKRDERGWMCVRTCFYLVRACVCVQKGMQGMNKQCEVCVCSEGWVLVYLCKETPVNLSTCMCVCVCVCVCGLKRSAYLSLTRPSVFQVGDFVSFPHSDPQSIDTRMKPNMHMLSSFHTQQRVRWLLRFPWCFLSTVYLCFTNVTLG